MIYKITFFKLLWWNILFFVILHMSISYKKSITKVWQTNARRMHFPLLNHILKRLPLLAGSYYMVFVIRICPVLTSKFCHCYHWNLNSPFITILLKKEGKFICLFIKILLSLNQLCSPFQGIFSNIPGCYFTFNPSITIVWSYIIPLLPAQNTNHF